MAFDETGWEQEAGAMLTAYHGNADALVAGPLPDRAALCERLVWIDLLAPSAQEEQAVQQLLGIDVPTREEMREIEMSSRLYEDNGALYMTASVLVNAEGPTPETSAITFILAGGRVITVRYGEPKPFQVFAARACKPGAGPVPLRGDAVLAGLIDAVVDRLADLLERVDAEIETASKAVFRRDHARPMRSDALNRLIGQIGQAADLNSRVGESLISIARLVTYLSTPSAESRLDKETRSRFKIALRDVRQLSDHASYLSGRITFLLDAVVGLISIEQNNIIKIFAVVSVVLMPPTLIASIYGMNFAHMPELGAPWAYPAVLLAMLASALGPFVYFRYRGWL